MPTVPTERLEAAWRDASAERRFWEDNEDRLRNEFPDEYIAVEDGQVVAHAPSLGVLTARVRSAGKHMDRVWIRFLAASDNLFIL